ncbi:hypothetical protein ElyMa_003373300 [Elysia marginata]|uniref:Uncharacterized protein n=1 Tax=Elysia marginata TaxID=1093978 RepID=A0AAV4JK74_9GAST|nr:hypothetical protein ElyMa_003373300 [Elysia marginata]
MKTHLHRILTTCERPDPLQFANKATRSVEDAILYVLNNSYAHLDKRKASHERWGATALVLATVALGTSHTLQDFAVLDETRDRVWRGSSPSHSGTRRKPHAAGLCSA